MFNSLEKVKQIIEHLKEYTYAELENQTYAIKEDELFYICEDYMTAQQCCDDYSKEIESLRNYIRLLEKENKELKEVK